MICDIFEAVQSTAKHSPIQLKKMLGVLSKSDKKNENLIYFFNGCVDKLLLSPKINYFVERTINFVAKLTSSFDDELMLEMMRHLCSRLTSSNKTVRQIVCQIIADTMAHMKESDIPMSCDLLSEVAIFLTTRLQDKTPTVRLWAVRALKYTQDESSESDSSASALIVPIVSDSSAVVRLEALKSVLIRKNVIPHICSRLRDVRPEIRIAALSRLAECHSRNVKQAHRLQVIQLCLTDRDPQVSAAGVKLVMTWVARLAESCSYNEAIEKLVKGLGPVQNEEVALLLGSTLVEELLRSDVQQAYDENLKDAVRTGRGVVWNGSITDISAHSILWVYVRCNYARQFCPVLAATEICDFLLPSAADIARLLGEANAAESGFASEERQFVVKYLLRVATLLVAPSSSTVLTSAAADCTRLVLSECQGLFTNPLLPVDLLEPALKTFYSLRCTTSSHVNVKAQTRALLLSTINTMADEASNAGQEQLTDGSSCERALQIAFWLIQQEVGTSGTSSLENGSDGQNSGASELTQLVPFVLSCVQQENPVIRCGAVGCLGLLCLLSRDVSAEYRHVLAQVASNGVEAGAIRREALKCLVDAACVHREQFLGDAGLCTVLLRAQQQHRHGDSSLGLVAMEGAAKLLFCGVVREPELLANLLHFFFQSDNPNRGDDDDDGDETCDDDAATRLHQLLSLFLQAFVLSADSTAEVVVEAVPQLVANITESVKHEAAKVSSLSAVRNLLSVTLLVRKRSPILFTGHQPSAGSVLECSPRHLRRHACSGSADTGARVGWCVQGAAEAGQHQGGQGRRQGVRKAAGLTGGPGHRDAREGPSRCLCTVCLCSYRVPISLTGCRYAQGVPGCAAQCCPGQGIAKSDGWPSGHVLQRTRSHRGDHRRWVTVPT